MDRVVVYPAEIPLTEDVLDGQRAAYIAVGHLAQLALGTRTAAAGFSVTANGRTLTIAPGAVYAPATVDAKPYGVLAADSSPLVLQYLSPTATTLTAPTSTTSYVYAVAAVTDAAPSVLPFYNAANPSETFAGQNNSGTALPTRRRNVATVAIGASIPTGAVPLWKVVATASAVTVTTAPAAPFYTTLPNASAYLCAPFDPVLAAAMGGYPKGVILPDATTVGTFWVSTADSNTTVPGATGANWKSLFDGLAQLAGGNDFTGNQTFEGNVWFTGKSGENAYIYNPPQNPALGVSGDVPNAYWVDQYYARITALNSEAQTRAQADAALNSAKANLAGGNDFTGDQTFEGNVTFTGATGFNAKITNAPAAPTTGVGGAVPNTYWVDQYYARTTALNSETAARTSADSTLQTNITNEANARIAADATKANLAGGNTFTGGDQTVNGTVVFGGATYSQQFIIKEPTFGMIVTLKAGRNNTDGTNYAIFSYVDSVQSYHEWQFKPGGGIFSTTKNDSVAFRGDLPTSGTITGGTYTKTPMNDGTGRSVLRQEFSLVVQPDGSGNATVTFPIACSEVPNVSVSGSQEVPSGAAGVAVSVRKNAAGTGVGTTTTNVPLYFWWSGGVSTRASMVSLIVEGIA